MLLGSRRPKGGWSRPGADPAHRPGGAPPHPGDGGPRRRVGVPAGMVVVAPRPSGGRQALPCHQARPSSTGTARRLPARARDNGGAAPCPEALPPHRRPVDSHRGVAAPKRRPWQAMARSPNGDRRYALGSRQRCLLEELARGGVRAVADDLLPLQQMAQRGSLAADNRATTVPVLIPPAHASKPKCRCRTRDCLESPTHGPSASP
jgi:hypothetical protein